MTRILIATDFSTRSDRALRRAILTATQCGGTLILAHVVDDDQPGHLIARQRAAVSELLEQTAQTIISVDEIPTDAIIVTGDPFAGILRVAEETEPSLIVIGPHRRQLLDIFIGTTAERTIQRARHPVLMANAVPSGAYERPLFAMDFDEASRAAADAVKHMEFIAQSNLTAVHMFDAPAAPMMKRAMEGSDAIGHYVDQVGSNARAQFDKFLSAAGMTGFERLLWHHEGSPAAALLRGAEDRRADLLIVGSSQRAGLRKIVLGSVAQQVLAEARCDVLVVPQASGARSPVERAN